MFGSSKNVFNRWQQHLRDLRSNKHYNPYFQATWNKYGEENFIFEIIEECENNEKILEETEQKWLDETKCYERDIGYNISERADRPNPMIGENHYLYGKKHSEETKQKISQKMTGKMMGDKNPNYGKKYSEETKEKISEQMTGKKHSKETKQRMSINNSGENHRMFGKTHTEATKKKMSEKKTGKKLSEETKKKIGFKSKGRLHSEESKRKMSKSLYIEKKKRRIERIDPKTGEVKEYKCIMDAVKEGFTNSLIIKCCKNIRNKHGGYYWQYLDK